MQLRTCVECGRTYMPSSRHHRCPACRSKDSCSCGSPKQGKSATCSACRTVAGASNGNWKGGQTRHKAGYIMARAPGHPRAAGSSSYVFEHVLVMEEMLGRFLLPGSPSITATAFETTTGQKTWSYGFVLSRRASAPATLSRGRDTYLNCTECWTPPTMLRVSTEQSGWWRESNPRPSIPHQGFSGRSLLCLFLSPGGLCRQAAERAQPLLDVPSSPAAGPDGGSS